MTRINAGIPPDRLSDKHLVAEYREISRIGTLVRKRVESKHGFDDIPSEFLLGTGHVKFFYNKGCYIVTRWESIVNEMRNRRFSARDVWDRWADIPESLMQEWDDGSVQVRSILSERIQSNMRTQKSPVRYYGKVMELNEYVRTILEK